MVVYEYLRRICRIHYIPYCCYLWFTWILNLDIQIEKGSDNFFSIQVRNSAQKTEPEFWTAPSVWLGNTDSRKRGGNFVFIISDLIKAFANYYTYEYR